MKILFIHCNINSQNDPHFVPGLASLSSYLKQAGHQTSLIFLQKAVDQDAFLAQVKAESPDLIGFSTVTNQWSLIRQHTRWLREKFTIPIIHGGTHVTVAPDESLQFPEIDLICVGEGEGALLDLAERVEQGLPYDDIHNLWVKKPDGRIKKNALRPLIQDLDTLPFPDREIFHFVTEPKDRPLQDTIFMAGRGCAYRCTYCVNHVLQESYQGLGRYVRLRSPDNILAEIKAVQKVGDLKRLCFFDDTLTSNRKWLERFCEIYGRECGLPFSLHVRLDTMDEKFLRILRAAGCDAIAAGIESGNPRVRTKVLGRRMSNQKIIDAFATARKLGMRTWAYYMIGFPTETPAEAADTVALHKLIKPDYAQVSVFYPYPGTELYELCRKEGYLTGREDTSFYFGFDLLKLPTITPEQIEGFVREINDSQLINILDKKPEGDYDFLANFPAADIETENKDYVRLTYTTLLDDERSILFAHPESRVTFAPDLPQRARLVFGMGFYPDTWSSDKGTGVYFEISVKQNEQEQTVFSRYVDPKNNPKDRKWVEAKVDLSKFEAGKAEISFITSTKGGDKSHCWSFWSRPVLSTNKKPTKSR